jgi:beta-glucosidase/6-phospho-beta-glucosidase/beta-galactosidase
MAELARDPTVETSLFGSMLMGGFKVTGYRRRDGRRLDVAAATGHDRRADEDYRLLHDHGMKAARDGLCWHRIERRQGYYDWSGLLPMLRAARDSGTTIIWDLLHYGMPDDIDPFSTDFIRRFACFARHAARVIASETDAAPLFTPVNAISFWAYAGGETAGLRPFANGRGAELKRQLVRAALAATDEVRAIDARTRIACAEPLIHVFPAGEDAESADRAADFNQAQHEALDMLLGLQAPELGGHADAVDIIGWNHYHDNQWIDGGRSVPPGDWRHRPLHQLLIEAAGRHGKPCYIAETGCEGAFRPYWLRYVASEVRQAQAHGVALGGICLYPVISHLGWDDDRPCANGLFDGHDPEAPRTLFAPLADEIAEQSTHFARSG